MGCAWDACGLALVPDSTVGMASAGPPATGPEAGLRLESRLKDTQLAVLVKVQKQAAAAGRVERWVRSTLSPVFHAWARLGAMEQARRGPRREAVKQEEAARKKAAKAARDRAAKAEARRDGRRGLRFCAGRSS